MKNMAKTIILTIVMISFWSYCLADPPRAPIAMLYQAKGTVEYSKNGTTWKPILRNKFLFEGYQIKTAKDSSCMLANQLTQQVNEMVEGSEIVIQNDSIKVVKGQLVQKEAQNILSDLDRKFNKAQKYTVIRRSAQRGGIKLSTAANITISKDYPDLVWESCGPEYSYRLFINDHSYDIPKTTEDVVRFSLKSFKPGDYTYFVEVIKNGQVVYSPEKKRNIHYMSDLERDKFMRGLLSIKEVAPDNDFVLANYMEEYGLIVPAMDQYHAYFQKNPEENEMKLFLIKIYNELKLQTLKKKEVDHYNRMFD